MVKNTIVDIMQKLGQNTPSDLIHCIFNCIQGEGFEGAEKSSN